MDALVAAAQRKSPSAAPRLIDLVTASCRRCNSLALKACPTSTFSSSKTRTPRKRLRMVCEVGGTRGFVSLFGQTTLSCQSHMRRSPPARTASRSSSSRLARSPTPRSASPRRGVCSCYGTARTNTPRELRPDSTARPCASVHSVSSGWSCPDSLRLLHLESKELDGASKRTGVI